MYKTVFQYNYNLTPKTKEEQVKEYTTDYS